MTPIHDGYKVCRRCCRQFWPREDGKMTKQRRYQLRMVERQCCKICGQPRSETSAQYCEKHRLADNGYRMKAKLMKREKMR